MIEIRHLKKKFGSLTVLKDVNAVIEKGEIISIIGPSGTGKSTLLRCLNLLETPDSGEIIFDGVDLPDPHTNIPAIRMKMGMVFQQFNLFPHLTVLENITISPRKLLKYTAAEAEEKAMHLLKLVGMENKAYAFPAELSGGQQQRAAIARTLAMNPEVILFDEPTSALDPTMVDEVLNVISRLAKTGITMIIVTHEMRFARNISTRVFYMDEGIIYEDGTPGKIFDSPEKPKTAAFVNRIDMRTFHLTRNDFTVDLTRAHARARAIELLERYPVKQEDREQLKNFFRNFLQKAIFPAAEELDLILGISKDNRDITAEIIWNGPVKNPLDDNRELAAEANTIFHSISFVKDESGRPCLKFRNHYSTGR